MPDSAEQICDSVAAVNSDYSHRIPFDEHLKRVLRAANHHADDLTQVEYPQLNVDQMSSVDTELLSRLTALCDTASTRPPSRILRCTPQQREAIGEVLDFLQRLVTEFDAGDPVAVEAASVLGRFVAHCCEFKNVDKE